MGRETKKVSTVVPDGSPPTLMTAIEIYIEQVTLIIRFAGKDFRFEMIPKIFHILF